MSAALHFLGISGSLRAQSRNTGLLRCARKMLAAVSEPDAITMDIADLSALPFYNADMQEKPESVCRLVEQTAKADALVLACPEYNYSLAPALKNALDWLSREPENKPLQGKPVAILGAGGAMGSSRAQYHLRQVCVYLDLRPLNKPEIFSDAFQSAFAANGDVADAALAERVGEQMRALADLCRRLK